jgi:hypothetical protein
VQQANTLLIGKKETCLKKMNLNEIPLNKSRTFLN